MRALKELGYSDMGALRHLKTMDPDVRTAVVLGADLPELTDDAIDAVIAALDFESRQVGEVQPPEGETTPRRGANVQPMRRTGNGANDRPRGPSRVQPPKESDDPEELERQADHLRYKEFCRKEGIGLEEETSKAKWTVVRGFRLFIESTGGNPDSPDLTKAQNDVYWLAYVASLDGVFEKGIPTIDVSKIPQ
jgi:hypothetical protein